MDIYFRVGHDDRWNMSWASKIKHKIVKKSDAWFSYFIVEIALVRKLVHKAYFTFDYDSPWTMKQF